MMVKTKQNKHTRALQSIFLVFAVCFIVGALPQVSAFTWSDDITSYYKLDESSGIVIDQLGLNNGINNGATAGVTGKIKTAYDFDRASSDYIDVDGLSTTSNQWTISMWVYPTLLNHGQYLFDSQAGRTTFMWEQDASNNVGYYDGTNHVLEITPAINNWYLLTLTQDGTDLRYYRDGINIINITSEGKSIGGGNVSIGSRYLGAGFYFDGKMDEVGIWDRVLIQTEVTELYNSGDGLVYSYGADINLESPLNEITISNTGINFTVSGSNLSSNNYKWKNITYYVWNTTGLFNETFVNITDNETFDQTLAIGDFVSGNYEWNVYGCYSNATYNNCTFSATNYTFEWRPFEIVSQDYEEFVYETDSQRFNLTINTLSSILNVDSKLNYNGTLYSATTSCSGGVCNIYSIIDIPLVASGETINSSFYWNITVYDGINTYSFDTTDEIKEQNITRIHLEKCGGVYTTQTINFTAYYETNLTRINPFYIIGTFDTWLGSGAIYRTKSFDESSTADLKLCITPTNKNQYSNAHIEYKFNDENITFIPRNYFFQNKTLTNISEEINLLLLTAEDSTSFIIKVQDQKLSPVTEALVYIQKYYPSTGLYKTVQIAKTDSNGETIGFYETETTDYKHIIIKNRITLLETASQKVVGKSVPYTLTFTIGTALGYPWAPFKDDTNVDTNLTFDDNTNIVTFNYIENTSGYVSSGRLLVFRNSLTNSTQLIICNVSSSESSATLTCDLGSYNGTFIAIAYINEGSEAIIQFTITDARDIFGNDGLFLAMMIILTAGFAMMWNPTAGIISINAAVIFVNIIGLMTVSPVFIFGMISISVITIVLLKT